MSNPETARNFAKENSKRFLEDLSTFIRIPSISTDPDHVKDMTRAAEWVAEQLDGFGFADTQVMPTNRHPVVYGKYDQAGPDAPTILIYGHYDVQPVDPLDEWDSEPFEPTIREENLFARGASDMKGQIVAQLKAVESLISTTGLPVNLIYMIEGEEEIGSPGLEAFILENESLFNCDFCLNADSGILGAEIPSLTYALRGLAYFEINIQGPASDLHSGTFGGAIENPANVLCDLIAGMRDENGRVTLPGFYDSVIPLGEDERAELARLPQDDEWWKEQSGAKALRGELGYSSVERATGRPTLDVNGIYSGFIGKGSKTVLPSQAMAKVSMRLVPDQQPDRVEQSLRTYLEENMPPTMSWELEIHAGSLPGMIDLQSKEAKAAISALESVWGKKPLYKREGGSVPVVGLLKEILDINSLMLGFGLPDDNLHAPNEKIYLPNYYRGIETYIRFIQNIAND
jgi:acetylornithine deacetylase/succinyl-diaminopimelate desuccinylase-like protein